MFIGGIRVFSIGDSQRKPFEIRINDYRVKWQTTILPSSHSTSAELPVFNSPESAFAVVHSPSDTFVTYVTNLQVSNHHFWVTPRPGDASSNILTRNNLSWIRSNYIIQDKCWFFWWLGQVAPTKYCWLTSRLFECRPFGLYSRCNPDHAPSALDRSDVSYASHRGERLRSHYLVVWARRFRHRFLT